MSSPHLAVVVVTYNRSAYLADLLRSATRLTTAPWRIVVVDNANRICGILSERDIVRALAAKGPDAMSAPVSSVMTPNVKVCSEAHSVNQLMEMMTQGRFRHLPVEVDGKLGGLVSIGDVVRMRIEQVEREAEEIKAYIAS